MNLQNLSNFSIMKKILLRNFALLSPNLRSDIWNNASISCLQAPHRTTLPTLFYLEKLSVHGSINTNYVSTLSSFT